MEITQNEIEFFHENGYLFKRNVLDKTLIEKCLDHYWQSAPEGFYRNDPKTWRGMIDKNAFTREGIQHQGYDWKDHTLKDTKYGRSLIAVDTCIIEAVCALTSLSIERPWVRGIFGVLPGSPGRGFHIDGPRVAPFIGVTGLLQDASPNAGNFTFYPFREVRRPKTSSARRRGRSHNPRPSTSVWSRSTDALTSLARQTHHPSAHKAVGQTTCVDCA